MADNALDDEVESLDTGGGTNSEQFENIIQEIDALRKAVRNIGALGACTVNHAEFLAAISKVKSLIAELEKMRKKDLVEVAGEMGSMGKTIENMQATIRKLHARIVAMSSGVKTYATFVRYIGMERPDENEAEVPVVEIRGNTGTLARVFFVVEGCNPKTLRYGEQLLVMGGEGLNHVVAAPGSSLRDGVEAIVTEALGSDMEGVRFVVRRHSSSEGMLVRLSSGVSASDVKEDSRVLVDQSSRLIIEVLPRDESKRYAVEALPMVTFDDVGGHSGIIEEITEKIAWPILYPEVYTLLHLPPLKGFCLDGPPGVGKTMIARAILNFLAKLLEERHDTAIDVANNFFHIAGPEIQDKYVGETERRMRDVFKAAREKAGPLSPVVIVIDEAESLLPIRGSGISSDVEKTNVTQFTALMDGLEERGNVIVILLTNRIDLMDSAVTRPGRCDKKITVPRPDKDAARDIFKKYLRPDEIHGKYVESPIYVPKDRSGRPRRDAKGKKIEFKFDKEPRKALEYLVDEAVARMYNSTIEANRFLSIKFADNSKWELLRYGDFASGALIANIVTRAKHSAVKRYIMKEDAHAGVQKKDLMCAIEEVFGELRPPQTLGIHNWLAIEGFLQGKRLEDWRFLKVRDTIAEDEDGD